MFNLIANENMKIYSRMRSWVMIGILIFVALISGVATYFLDYKINEGQDWKASIVTEIQDIQKDIEKDRAIIPQSELDKANAHIKLKQYYIDNDINPHHYNAWTFTKSVSDSVLLVVLFALVIAADSVSSEFSWGTIKLLLIRPVSRSKIYFSKYIAIILHGLFLMAVFTAAVMLIGGLFFGFGGLDEPYRYILNGEIQEMTSGQSMLLGLGTKVIYLFVLATIAFMISAAFRSTTAALAITMVLLALFPPLAMFLSSFSWSKFTLFTNIDLMQYVEGSPIVEGTTAGFSAIVILVYLIVFHIIGWRVFTKRDVAA